MTQHRAVNLQATHGPEFTVLLVEAGVVLEEGILQVSLQLLRFAMAKSMTLWLLLQGFSLVCFGSGACIAARKGHVWLIDVWASGTLARHFSPPGATAAAAMSNTPRSEASEEMSSSRNSFITVWESSLWRHLQQEMQRIEANGAVTSAALKTAEFCVFEHPNDPWHPRWRRSSDDIDHWKSHAQPPPCNIDGVTCDSNGGPIVNVSFVTAVSGGLWTMTDAQEDAMSAGEGAFLLPPSLCVPKWMLPNLRIAKAHSGGPVVAWEEEAQGLCLRCAVVHHGAADASNAPGMTLTTATLMLVSSTFLGCPSCGGPLTAIDSSIKAAFLAIESSQQSIIIQTTAFHCYHCHFAYNAGNYGGVMRLVESRALLHRSLFRRNSAATEGGAVAVLGGAALLSQCTFEGNHAGSDGGAMYVSQGATLDSQVLVVDSHFQQNSAQRNGGSLAVEGSAVLEIRNTAVKYSVAEGSGGAVAVMKGATAIVNASSIQETLAAASGGAAACSGVSVNSPSRLVVSGSSVAFAFSDTASAVAATSFCNFNMTSSIVMGCVATSASAAVVMERSTAAIAASALLLNAAGGPLRKSLGCLASSTCRSQVPTAPSNTSEFPSGNALALGDVASILLSVEAAAPCAFWVLSTNASVGVFWGQHRDAAFQCLPPSFATLQELRISLLASNLFGSESSIPISVNGPSTLSWQEFAVSSTEGLANASLSVTACQGLTSSFLPSFGVAIPQWTPEPFTPTLPSSAMQFQLPQQALTSPEPSFTPYCSVSASALVCNSANVSLAVTLESAARESEGSQGSDRSSGYAPVVVEGSSLSHSLYLQFPEAVALMNVRMLGPVFSGVEEIALLPCTVEGNETKRESSTPQQKLITVPSRTPWEPITVHTCGFFGLPVRSYFPVEIAWMVPVQYQQEVTLLDGFIEKLIGSDQVAFASTRLICNVNSSASFGLRVSATELRLQSQGKAAVCLRYR